MKRPDLSNISILVVDDYNTIRAIMGSSLEKIGFKNVQFAVNGRQAHDMIRAQAAAGNPFSIVFSDWSMPEMNGLELLKAIRADEQIKSTIFVMVTVETERDKVKEALLAGANDYMIKPFRMSIIDKKIESIIEMHMKKEAVGTVRQ